MSELGLVHRCQIGVSFSPGVRERLRSENDPARKRYLGPGPCASASGFEHRRKWFGFLGCHPGETSALVGWAPQPFLLRRGRPSILDEGFYYLKFCNEVFTALYSITAWWDRWFKTTHSHSAISAWKRIRGSAMNRSNIKPSRKTGGRSQISIGNQNILAQQEQADA